MAREKWRARKFWQREFVMYKIDTAANNNNADIVKIKKEYKTKEIV